jgi:hypothetical protein
VGIEKELKLEVSKNEFRVPHAKAPSFLLFKSSFFAASRLCVIGF